MQFLLKKIQTFFSKVTTPSLQKRSFIPIRFNIKELSGSLGDLGVFVPIYISLVALSGLPPISSLVIVGAVYILSGLYFRLPVPVQPLKAMAAIAVAEGLGYQYLAAGGIWIGFILLLLSASGTIEKLNRYFTSPIIKGVQLGVGLMLLKAGIKLLAGGGYPSLQVASTAPINLSIFVSSLWIMVIPQLPLTLGNAIYAMSETSGEYFGEGSKKATPGRLGLSLGMANIVAGFAGGLPVCHGSGGLTAHYRFGARTAGATIITGSIFILVALILGSNALTLMASIPGYIFGLMLLYVGICHAKLYLNLTRDRGTALVMGAVGLFTSNLALALFTGLILENGVRLAEHLVTKKTLFR